MPLPDKHTPNIIERLRDRAYSFKAPDPLLDEAAAEIERLREAIRRLADQDATLSVCAGNVIVQMDSQRHYTPQRGTR